MNDALTQIIHLEFGDTKGLTIGIERFNLQTRHRIFDTVGAITGRHIVISHGEHR